MRPNVIRLAASASITAMLLLIILVGARTDAAAQLVAAVSIAILAGHAAIGLGLLEAAVFGSICLFVTFTLENVGVITGFPFGHYSFLVGQDLPHIGRIPIIVGPLYFGMGYASWIIANLLVGSNVERPDTLRALTAIPLTAAFVMTQWDLVMDPSGSTLSGAWIWYKSGGYFGVPLSNYLGWYLVTWLFFQGFAVFAYRQRSFSYKQQTRLFWALPVLFYLAAGLCRLPALSMPDSDLVDAAGRLWSASDLRESAVIVMLFTMLPTSLLALLRLAALERSMTDCAAEAPNGDRARDAHLHHAN